MSRTNEARAAQKNNIPEHAHDAAAVAHGKPEHLSAHEQTKHEEEVKREQEKQKK